MSGRETNDTILILRQMQEKFLIKKKNLYLAFVDLEKPLIEFQKILSGASKWLVKFVQGMYRNAQSRVRINSTFSEKGYTPGIIILPYLINLW